MGALQSTLRISTLPKISLHGLVASVGVLLTPAKPISFCVIALQFSKGVLLSCSVILTSARSILQVQVAVLRVALCSQHLVQICGWRIDFYPKGKTKPFWTTFKNVNDLGWTHGSMVGLDN